MDAGTRATEQAQARMEREFRKVYRQAQEEITQKLDEHWKKFKVKDVQKRKLLAEGKITPEEYKHWLNGQVFIGKQWQDKVTSVATSLLTANQQANSIVEGNKRAVFGENATYQAYSMEHEAGMDLSFGIYDSATVTRLLRDQPELLPRKIVNGKKDMAWNRINIANAITQGVIQGESVPEIAKRIARDTSSTNMKAMTRYARTAMTGAQNAGRLEAMRDALDMGIKVKKKWIATLDSRTRDAHQDLDGQVQEIEKPFQSALGNIMCPGDPAAHPGNVWNCRCTLGWVYDEYPEQYSQRRAYVEYVDDEGKYHRESHEIANMSYKVWKLAKDRDNQLALEEWRNKKYYQQAGKEIKAGGHVTDLIVSNIFNNKIRREILIKNDTGVTYGKAAQYLDGVQAWAGNEYYSIREYQENMKVNPEDIVYLKTREKNLEEFIEKATKWNGGTTYRAIGLTEGELNDMIKKAKSGGRITMKGTSSWTTDLDYAKAYSIRKKKRIIFISETQKNGTSIRAYSLTPFEFEVLVSKKSSYIVKKIEETIDAVFFYCEE